MGIQKNKEKYIINAKERKQIENREAIDNIKRAYSSFIKQYFLLIEPREKYISLNE